MNIFIINLDKDVKRRKCIKNQFNKQMIKYNLFKAIYGKDVIRKGIQHLSTDGQIGCFSSHYEIWKIIKKIKKYVNIRR